MSGNAETERERLCRQAVVAYLRRLGLEVACGPKRRDDPPDYDLSVGGERYALEASTLEDDEPGVALKPVTREKRFEKLCARLEREMRTEGSLRHGYMLAYPWEPFDRPAKTEALILERARRAIREDGRAAEPVRLRQLWSPYERLGLPLSRAVDGALGVDLYGATGAEPRIWPQGKPRTRGGDADDLARNEIIPRIQEIAERKAGEMAGERRARVLALANEHLLTGSSSYRALFRREANAQGFAEIFIVGREAVPLLGRFEAGTDSPLSDQLSTVS